MTMLGAVEEEVRIDRRTTILGEAVKEEGETTVDLRMRGALGEAVVVRPLLLLGLESVPASHSLAAEVGSGARHRPC